MRWTAPLVLSAALLGATACAPTAATQPGAATADPAGAAETNTGETPAVRYTDTKYAYTVDAPGKMTANPDGSASVVGPLERLEIHIVEGAALGDPAAFAAKDLASLKANTPGFALISGPSAIKLGSRTAQKIVYRWNAGTSAVTGKPVDLVGVRYWIPKTATTLAVMTYGITATQYDPQGADDTALTFTWK